MNRLEAHHKLGHYIRLHNNLCDGTITFDYMAYGTATVHWMLLCRTCGYGLRFSDGIKAGINYPTNVTEYEGSAAPTPPGKMPRGVSHMERKAQSSDTEDPAEPQSLKLTDS